MLKTIVPYEVIKRFKYKIITCSYFRFLKRPYFAVNGIYVSIATLDETIKSLNNNYAWNIPNAKIKP